MRTPTATDLLEVWERTLDCPGARRAIALVASLRPELTADEIGGLTVGQRDALLLRLRERLFGPEMRLVADCPACSMTLESTLRLAELRNEKEPSASPLALSIEGYRISFRSPAAVDLIGLPLEIEAARLTLLDRCLVNAEEISGDENRSMRAADLPDSVIVAISECMAAADPLADAQLNLNCPSCQHRWPAVFDIASALWREIHAWAKRILRDVDALARTYGWSEAEVLSLSPTRRQVYLELSRQ